MISREDIRLTKSQVVNDSGTNGGRLGTVTVNSGVAGNVFPDASQAERTAGSKKYRKAFYHNRHIGNEVAYDFMVYVENYTPAGDEVVFFEGTQTDTQMAITGNETLYGCGQLSETVAPGATSVKVVVHDWSELPVFRNGDLIRISNKANIDDELGVEEYGRIEGAPSAAGNVVTLALEAALLGGYDAADTRVASVCEIGDLRPTITDWAENSELGTFDETTYPVTGTNRGTIEQTWTLTFTGASAFTVSGDVLGPVGSGSISTPFSPTNPETSDAYFTLNHLGWGGTWGAGDTVVFKTHPSACPLWFLRDIPAMTAAQNGNRMVLAWQAGSE